MRVRWRVMELAQTITAAELTGRVIIIPAMNLSGVPRGNQDFTYRPGQFEPDISRQARWNGNRKNRRLFPAHAAAHGGCGG